jgi:YHS domain-containing protein
MATQNSQNTQSTPRTDPVCGMQVDPATAAGQSEYQGVTYHFCSMGCKRQFDRDPQRFVGGQPQPS